MQNDFFTTDIITRTFLKPRGEYIVSYVYTTRAGIFKTPQAPNSLYGKLMNYLSRVFANGCEYKPLGCSDCQEVVGVEIIESKDYEIVMLANKSEYAGNGNKQHFICQDYFLKNEPSFLCYELPVWNDERSGFIDLIRWKDDKVWIFDLKPNACKEKPSKVLSQLWNYKALLQHQLECNPDDIECVYFDNANIYQLKQI